MFDGYYCIKHIISAVFCFDFLLYCVLIFNGSKAERFSFDILDPGPCFNSVGIPLLINGFASVKTCLLIPCGTDFYAIIVFGIFFKHALFLCDLFLHFMLQLF